MIWPTGMNFSELSKASYSFLWDLHAVKIYKCYVMLLEESTIIFIIFWDFSIFYQIFLSAPVKRSVTISNKHGIT